MYQFTDKQMEQIQKVIESSPKWAEINAKVKALYQQFNRIPSDEEYQAVRTMIICKTALEDENVMKVLSDCTWEVLQAEAI